MSELLSGIERLEREVHHCPICDQTQTHTNTCTHCQQHLRQQLHNIANLWLIATTDPTLTPTTSSPGRTNTNPLPGGTAWLSWSHGADLQALLTSWATLWIEHLGWTNPPPRNIPDLCTWHANHLHRFASHPAILDYANEINAAYRSARYHAGQTNPAIIPARCPTLTDTNTECDTNLRITHSDLADMTTTIRCPRCNTNRSILQILAIAAEQATNNPDIGVDLDWAARLLNMSERNVYRLAQTGRIKRDRQGRYLIATYNAG